MWCIEAALRVNVGTLLSLNLSDVTSPGKIMRCCRRLLATFWISPCRHCDHLALASECHAWAAFDQCNILAELDPLQLGESLRTAALDQGGYDNESFDVMITIADVLVSEHGWSAAQSDGWLERMGLWQDD